MIMIVEGIDASGKSTLVKKLAKSYRTTNVLHFEFPQGSDNQERALWQKAQFDLLFKTMSTFNNRFQVLILDRSHIGERVWGPLYRGLDVSYLDELEKNYSHLDVKIICMTADEKDVLQRHDERGEKYPGYNINEISEKLIEACHSNAAGWPVTTLNSSQLSEEECFAYAITSIEEDV